MKYLSRMLLFVTLFAISIPTISNAIEYGSLQVGHTYIISKQTPIIPSFNTSDTTKYTMLSSGSGFEVLEIRPKIVNNEWYIVNIWYRVNAYDIVKAQIISGWIDSVALFGQDIKEYKIEKD